MFNKLIFAIALGLFTFQILFSVYYSGNIVEYNQKYSELEKKFSELKSENQELEINYANKYAIHGNITP